MISLCVLKICLQEDSSIVLEFKDSKLLTLSSRGWQIEYKLEIFSLGRSVSTKLDDDIIIKKIKVCYKLQFKDDSNDCIHSNDHVPDADKLMEKNIWGFVAQVISKSNLSMK